MADSTMADAGSSANPDGSAFGASLGTSCVRGVLTSTNGAILDSGTRSFTPHGDLLETAVGETLAIAEFYGVENPVLAVADADALDPDRFDGVRLVGEIPAVIAAVRATSILELSSIAVVVDVGRASTRVYTLDTIAAEMVAGESTEHFSGDVCDAVVVDHLRAMYAVEPVSDADLAQLAVDASDAKLWLGGRSLVDVPGPFESGSVRLRRNVFDALIAPALSVVSAMVTTALARNSVDAVLLIGGGANIEAVSRAIMAITELPVLTPDQPEMFTAIGAAALGAATLPAPAPAPAAAPTAVAPVADPAPTASAPAALAAVSPLVVGVQGSATDLPAVWQGPLPAAPAPTSPASPTPARPTPATPTGRSRPAAKRVLAAEAAAAAAAAATIASTRIASAAPPLPTPPLPTPPLPTPPLPTPPLPTPDSSQTVVIPVDPGVAAAVPLDQGSSASPPSAPAPPADDGGNSPAAGGFFSRRVRVAVASLAALVIGVLAVAIALAAQPSNVEVSEPVTSPARIPDVAPTLSRAPAPSSTSPSSTPTPVTTTPSLVTSTTDSPPPPPNDEVTPPPGRVVPVPRVTTTQSTPIVTQTPSTPATRETTRTRVTPTTTQAPPPPPTTTTEAPVVTTTTTAADPPAVP